MYFKQIVFIGVLFLLTSLQAFHASQKDETGSFLPTGIYPISESKTSIEKYFEKDEDTYFIVSKPIIAVERFDSVKVNKIDDDLYGLQVTLDETGKKELADASTNAVGVKWAFIVNNYLWAVARVNTPITEGELVMSGGHFTQNYLEDIASQIQKNIDELSQPRN